MGGNAVTEDEKRQIRRIAAVLLGLVAPSGVLFAIVFAAVVGGILALPADLALEVRGARFGVGALGTLAAGTALTGLSLVAAWGLWRGWRSGPVLGLVCGALWSLSACGPCGWGIVALLAWAAWSRPAAG